MYGACLACLSQKNLLVLSEKEWNICNYMLHPYIMKYPDVRSNSKVKVCYTCHDTMQNIDTFRRRALQNFLRLMVLFHNKQQELSTFQTDPLNTTELVIKSEAFDNNEQLDMNGFDEGTTEYTITPSNLKLEDIKINNKFKKENGTSEWNVEITDTVSVDVKEEVTSNSDGHSDIVVPVTVYCQTNIAENECKDATSSDKKEKLEKSKKDNVPCVCTVCNKTLKNKRGLYRHKLTFHSGERVHCVACDKWFRVRAYKVHLMTSKVHNKELTLAKQRHECSICKKSVIDIAKHMKMHTEAIYCRTCDKCYSNSSSYKLHLRTNLNHINKEDLRFACDDCGAKYSSKVAITRHIFAVHLNLKPHKCTLCPRSYVEASKLRKHVERQHEKKPIPKNHVCEICGTGFEKKPTLLQHMVTHTGERPFKCEECDATFGYNAALYTHKKLKHKKQAMDTAINITEQEYNYY